MQRKMHKCDRPCRNSCRKRHTIFNKVYWCRSGDVFPLRTVATTWNIWYNQYCHVWRFTDATETESNYSSAASSKKNHLVQLSMATVTMNSDILLTYWTGNSLLSKFCLFVITTAGTIATWDNMPQSTLVQRTTCNLWPISTEFNRCTCWWGFDWSFAHLIAPALP